MAFTWNRFAYTNFHELNLDWFNEHFKEIFEEWEELYNTLTQWKDDTDADLAQWKEDTLSEMDTWERELLAALDEWKVDTGNDISYWESGVISDLNDWKETFLSAYESLEDRVEAIVSDTEDMVENLAEPFSASVNYAKGDYVIYNGVLYRFTTTHNAGAWNASHVEQTTAMNDISIIRNNLFDFNIVNIFDNCAKTSETYMGIKYEWHNDSTCTVTGTATSTSFNTIFGNQNALPGGLSAGDTVEVQFSSSNIYLYIYDFTGGATTILYGAKTGGIFKIPATCTGLLVRLWIANGTQNVNEIVKPVLLNYNRIIREGGYIKAVDTASANETNKIDMMNAIQYALDTYKYCHLSEGCFYVSQRVWMPEGSTLEGEGPATEIRLLAGNNKHTINAHKNSLIKNLSVIGSYTDLTEEDLGTAEGDRYGIFYRKGGGDYSQATGYVGISNVQIKNFTAAGIYQYDAGQNVSQGIFVENVEIKNCFIGIQIYSLSEFCHYVNVKITYCFYACVNNGGNNVFDSCVFHAYYCGMRINGSLPNSGHGSCSNSSFCHTGNDEGMALHITNLTAGFIFSANNFWYNSIVIIDSEGVVFNGCEFGRGTTGAGMNITITGGNTNMFNGCVFINDTSYAPVLSVTNKTKFSGCYGSTSGNAITA